MKKMWKNQPVIWLMLVAMIFQLFPQMMGLGYVNAEIQDEDDIGENLVIYPSYEEDVDFEPHVGGQAKVGNWFYYGEGVERVKNEPHSGDYAARLSSTSDALEQDIQDLQVGETYKLSVWAKNTNPDKTSAYIVLKNYGGNEKQLKIDSSEYEQYEAQFVFTGDKDDMPRIAAWVEESSEGEVYVDDWELVSEGSDIADLNIENGLITVDFDENYQGNITKNNFQATYSNSSDSGNVKELPIVSESVSDNTLMMEYTAFEKKPIEQEITVNLQYMPDNQSTAINYSLEFTVESSGEPLVEAKIESIEAEDGHITITLDDNPTIAPVENDFAFEYKVNDGQYESYDIQDFQYNEKEKTVEFNFTPVRAGAYEQTVTVKVTYNDHFDTTDYVLEALETGEGVAYYVDAKNGDDNNDGTSPELAWKTIEKVNEIEFEPGDQILFRAGEEWTGALKPQGSGVKDAPIVIGSYGSGDKPILKPGEDWTISHMNIASQVVYDPVVNNVITFFNQEYWEVRDLELYDPTYEENEQTSVYRRGINISAEDAGDLNYFNFDNLEIHGFRGPNTNEGKSSGGIIMTVTTHLTDESKRVPTALHDITVTNSELYDLGRSGINFVTPWTTREGEKWNEHEDFGYAGLGSWKPNENLTVSNNIIHDIDGDGAIIDNVSNALVDHNIVYRTGFNSWYAVGLFNWNSDDVIFEYNEVYDTVPADSLLAAGDGQGIEIDALNQDTYVQYNYMHDNSGGTFMWCNTPSLLGFNGVFRYNISQNDGTRHGVFDWRPGHKGSQAYNNTIYHEDTGDTGKFMENGATGMSDAEIFNNIFVNRGDIGDLDFIESEIDWERNIFTGYDELPENDESIITDDPLFVDENTGEIGWDTVTGYSLQPESPAIDAGLEIDNNGGQDYFGTLLTDGKPDIGAVEFVKEDDVPVKSVSDLKTLVEQYEESGDISNDDAVHALKIHLTALEQFEKIGANDKVVKHLNGFKDLLDHQKEVEKISDEAYDTLTKGADTLIDNIE
ncbi:right-handed parallel beta-helix repeat-containing protein [Virgibacillus sp. MSJ-26]|uniref:FIMAH domain-containing protein n=1 Tax=Virgibacillus sp. MSJ-26 TaxID=2841522 RepID=UPI001C0F99D4|nr:carbohydrate binding domain-containing protein [Virgibacillus sp. MSJ-26]MBU5468197.1 right-handed parallel beta-helix repeat-containing protein [Virgibacillus sp. MSJ-26]